MRPAGVVVSAQGSSSVLPRVPCARSTASATTASGSSRSWSRSDDGDFTGQGGVGAKKQVTQRPPASQRDPDPTPVLGAVVQQVTSLAHRPHIAVSAAAMARIMVEMRCRQHDLGRPHRRALGHGRRGNPPAPAVAPSLLRLVPPSSIAQVFHGCAMGSTTDLAAAACTYEPDPVADLPPVDRVVPAQLRLDRHDKGPASGFQGRGAGPRYMMVEACGPYAQVS